MLCCFLGMSLLIAPRSSYAESEEEDYSGVTDPFGDPSNYEFKQDEKEDKQYFHLGRFLMLGLDLGYGIVTQGLGSSTSPSFYFGGRVVYFFDLNIAMELGVHYSSLLTSYRPVQGTFLDINMELVPITLGIRYYIPVQGAPKPIAIANPYVCAGLGDYLRTQTTLDQQNSPFTVPNSTTSNFGFFVGGGLEFPIYGNHLFVGADFRYHFIYFTDRNNYFFTPGDRNGGYFTPAVIANYSF